MKKRTSYLILVIALPLIGYSQSVPSSCTAAASIADLYKVDASILTLVKTRTTNTNYKDSVPLDPLLYNSYSKALLSVYNATVIPARDTVVTVLGIHYKYFGPGHTVYLTKELKLSADSNLQWVKNINNNIFPCGNSQVDSYISTYSLKKVSALPPYSNPINFRFRSDSLFNMKKLAEKINLISGVSAQEFGVYYYYNGGGQITDSIGANFIQLIYSVHWEDCFIGCLEHSYWKFRVYTDCSVEYLGHWGSSISGLLAGTSAIQESDQYLRVFPNPVKEKLKFESALKIDELNILNALGQKVYTIYAPESKKEIDISFLPAGVYYLKIDSRSGRKVVKMIKE